MIEANGSQFQMNDFQQMLFVCPDFFIHRWDVVKGDRVELFVDVPANIRDILAKQKQYERVAPDEVPYANNLNDQLANRKILFKRSLVTLIYKAYLAFQVATGLPDNYEFTNWPAPFDVDSLPQLPAKDLKPAPKVQKKDEISGFLKQYDIREKLMAQEFALPNQKSESSATTPRRRNSEDKVL